MGIVVEPLSYRCWKVTTPKDEAEVWLMPNLKFKCDCKSFTSSSSYCIHIWAVIAWLSLCKESDSENEQQQ